MVVWRCCCSYEIPQVLFLVSIFQLIRRELFDLLLVDQSFNSSSSQTARSFVNAEDGRAPTGQHFIRSRLRLALCLHACSLSTRSEEFSSSSSKVRFELCRVCCCRCPELHPRLLLFPLHFDHQPCVASTFDCLLLSHLKWRVKEIVRWRN